MAIQYDETSKTYSVVIKSKDPVTGKLKWRKKRGFRLKREAAAWEAEERKNSTTPTIATFRSVSEEQIRYLQTSDSQTEKKRQKFRDYFTDYYDVPIDKITKRDLTKWNVYMFEESGLAPKTINETIGFVRSVFNFANTVYGLPNPAIVLRNAKKAEKKEMQVWTPEEFQRFINSVDEPVYKIFFEFLYWTGCRRGEALALQQSDVSPEGEVRITKSIKHFKNGFNPTKTGETRTIKLDDMTFEHLKPLLDPKLGPFVFGAETSLSLSTIDKQFNAGIRKSGVKKIRLHDLRHSHATWLINNGANIVAVSKRLGHATIDQTLKTYTHLLQKTDDEMLKKINLKRKKLTKS